MSHEQQLLTRPAHSIIKQSYDSRLRLDTGQINGDGFGVGDGGVGVGEVFEPIKRKLQQHLSDEIFSHVQGNTDSEWAFALFLSKIEDLENGRFSYRTLQAAMLETIEHLNALSRDEGIEESVVCTRYINSESKEAASLYFSSGTSFTEYKPGHYRMIKADKREDIVLVASEQNPFTVPCFHLEPLTFEKADWLTIPTNTCVVITPGLNVLLFPIKDQFYNPERSKKLFRVNNT
ncbi:5811_t:CDS:2 [Acaulospora colombiana]|uniref:5811_t:CDS:1 n=1 Tax=Acaulospora colombiana TaxID=27376 RepID=A0ACA9K449_9GLOM|nr:5811_t:CDS:2 [Acaulospora colombiana]